MSPFLRGSELPVSGDKVASDPSRVEIFGVPEAGNLQLAEVIKCHLLQHGATDPYVGRTHDVADISSRFFNRTVACPESTTPGVVIAFSHMRQNQIGDAAGKLGAVVDTPTGSIQDLCERYNVPLLSPEAGSNSTEVANAVGHLLFPLVQQ